MKKKFIVYTKQSDNQIAMFLYCKAIYTFMVGNLIPKYLSSIFPDCKLTDFIKIYKSWFIIFYTENTQNRELLL